MAAETKKKKKDTRHNHRPIEGAIKKKKIPKNRAPLGDTRTKKKQKSKNEPQQTLKTPAIITTVTVDAGSLPAPKQLSFFLNQFQSSNGLKLSPLELQAIKDTCMLELPEGIDQDAESLGKHIKTGFGKSWKEVLCDGQILDGKIDPGSPAVVVVSTSALRSLELLRGLRSLTKDCRAAKLFAKHMKVEEQVSVLKSRVNIASGTPSRIKKLIDMEALGLSRLSVVVFDMHTDAKGYSLFTLPQVSDEFWDLYRSHFHPLIIEGNLRICLYGPISLPSEPKTDV
ncbi:hypothetical protein ACHQM5_013866 [Ranunculus cassubicifolius]